jgi:hypothetical protein
VFDNNSQNEETSFADAYKSQILNPSDEEEEKSALPKIIGIIVLIVLISGLSIYGYKYINDNKSTEKRDQEEPQLPPSSIMIDNIDELEEEALKSETKTPQASKKSNTENIADIADKVKIELSKEIEKNHKEEPKKSEQASLPVSKQKGEDTYLEQLAELSKEIDGEN